MKFSHLYPWNLYRLIHQMINLFTRVYYQITFSHFLYQSELRNFFVYSKTRIIFSLNLGIINWMPTTDGKIFCWLICIFNLYIFAESKNSVINTNHFCLQIFMNALASGNKRLVYSIQYSDWVSLLKLWMTNCFVAKIID